MQPLLFVLLIIPSFEGFSKEPLIAVLENIYANNLLEFGYKSHLFRVHPYGVTTLEDIYHSNASSQECKKDIEDFYTHHPKARYFYTYVLHVKQSYHIENMKNNRFVIYAKGEKSYAEILLDEGLAMIENEEKLSKRFRYRFVQAQKNARRLKRGIFSEGVLQHCKN